MSLCHRQKNVTEQAATSAAQTTPWLSNRNKIVQLHRMFPLKQRSARVLQLGNSSAGVWIRESSLQMSERTCVRHARLWTDETFLVSSGRPHPKSSPYCGCPRQAWLTELLSGVWKLPFSKIKHHVIFICKPAHPVQLHWGLDWLEAVHCGGWVLCKMHYKTSALFQNLLMQAIVSTYTRSLQRRFEFKTKTMWMSHLKRLIHALYRITLVCMTSMHTDVMCANQRRENEPAIIEHTKKKLRHWVVDYSIDSFAKCLDLRLPWCTAVSHQSAIPGFLPNRQQPRFYPRF